MRILGIDPGLQKAGWGIVDIQGSTLRHVAHGIVRTAQDDRMGDRLKTLFQGLVDVIHTYQPQEAAIEDVFLNKNPGSTLKLGMARGVCMLAPSHCGITVAEYSANQIKKAVVGVGHATKDQMEMMVGVLLPQCGAKDDAADALGVAICHSHIRQSPYVDVKNDCKTDGTN